MIGDGARGASEFDRRIYRDALVSPQEAEQEVMERLFDAIVVSR